MASIVYIYYTDCFQSRADIRDDEMHAGIRRNKAECELMSAFFMVAHVIVCYTGKG